MRFFLFHVLLSSFMYFSRKDIEKVNKMYKCSSAASPPSTTTPQPSDGPTTTKPRETFLGSLVETLFPSSSMDEEEMLNE